MVDSYEDIVKKYQQNLRGIFRKVRMMFEEADKKGASVPPRDLIETAEDIIIRRDPVMSMTKLVISMSDADCIKNIIDKNIEFFKEGWKNFLGSDVNSVLIEVGSMALSIYDKADSTFQKEDINKLFDFVYSIFKVSIKMVLIASGIKVIDISDEGHLYYALERELDPALTSEIVSNLIKEHKVTGIPTNMKEVGEFYKLPEKEEESHK